METSSSSEIPRCQECNKKLKLMIFSCKCGNKYCLNHMNPADHNCQFDFKKEHKKFLAENNPVIVPQKV